MATSDLYLSGVVPEFRFADGPSAELPGSSRSGPLADPGTVRILLVAAVCVAVYLLAGPPHNGDFAAQIARADLFRKAGFVPYWAGWYTGVNIAGYSLLTPPLMAVLSPAGVGVICLVSTAVISLRLLRPARRPILGACAFTLSALADLLSGRVTFAAGATFGLAAVLAAERRRPVWAGVLSGVAAITSPVAGLFMVVVAVGYLFGGRDRRRFGLIIGSSSLGCLGLFAIAFPGQGIQPFPAAAMFPALLTCLGVAAVPLGRRVRISALAAAALVLLAFVVGGPVGSNAARLPELVAAPTIVAGLPFAGRWMIAALAAVLPWPAHQLASDVAASAQPGANTTFYQPLVAELARLPALRTGRVEVIVPQTHWQVVALGPLVMQAGGDQRQLDVQLLPPSYGHAPLTATVYRQFLDRASVAAIALPVGTPIDLEYAPQATLIERGVPYLHEVWTDDHWRLYLVDSPAPLASGDGAQVLSLTGTEVRLRTTGPGFVRLKLSWSAYLTVTGGCVKRGPDGTTLLHVRAGGIHDLEARWSLDGILGRTTC